MSQLHDVCTGLCVRGSENIRGRSNEEEINISCTYSGATLAHLYSVRQNARPSGENFAFLYPLFYLFRFDFPCTNSDDVLYLIKRN
jgi:hypothetical protein